MHTVIIILLPAIVFAYDLLCPDHSQRQLRGQGLCVIKNTTHSIYTCLEDVYRPRLTFIESCSEEEDVVRRGKRFVFKSQSRIGDCSTDRYQPIPFYKTSGPMCIFLKSLCTEVGQMVATKGSGISDTTCICDYTEGYAYVTRPADVCNCVPSEEDCTCYEKMCQENYLLTADYECIHINATRVTIFATVDKSENNFTSTTTSTIGTDSTAFNESPTRVQNAVYAAIVMTVIILILSGVIIGVLLYLINRDIEYFTKALESQTCTEGEDVHFECEVLDDKQTPHWFKDGSEVFTSDRYKVEKNGKLRRLLIINTTIDDKGEYSVRIKNCFQKADLIVKEYFTKGLVTQTCIEGEDVALECEVLGDKQTAKWFKDGIRVIASDKYKVERHGRLHRLVVNSTKCDDKGEYSVRINNCTRLCKLTVQEYFTKALNTQACTDGEDVQFECEVLGDNQTALWFKDGIGLSTYDRYKVERRGKLHRLIVNNTKLADKGEYSVSINNCTRLCKLIVQELPRAIHQLSEEDKGLYLEIIKSGTETRYYIRIVIIGENGVGKTCLLRRLLGEQIEGVKSTEGIDVVQRCKIRLSDGQWIIDKDANKRKDIVTRIIATLSAKTLENQQNQPGISKENRQAEMTKISGEGQIEGTKLLAPSIDDKDKMEAIKPSTLSLNEEKQGNSVALYLLNNEMKLFRESNQVKNTEKKIATGLVETSTKIIINELSQFIKDTDTNDKEVLVHLGFWDFAGQKEYYPTHPIFLNPCAVHLLVTDITKDIKKINTERGYDQIGEYIDFWFDSIHSCRDVDDTKESTGDHLNPPVIVVCTHIDKCEDKLEEETKFRQQLTTLLKNDDKRKHLRRICYISNIKPAEKDLDYLRQSIFECGKMIETFGEKLPLKWIRLEQALDILCKSDINIMSLADMAVLASEFSIQNEKQLNLFLKYHHKIGNIIYFESLKDHIILNPKWLADAFRCFIADGEKYDMDLKLTDDWKLLEETGELKRKLIVKLLEKEKERQFYKYMDHILKLLEMFSIIVKFLDEKQNVPTYYMPCMISKNTSINQVYDVFGVLRDTVRRTPWLCIQFDFMPFDFFNHILFQYIKKYLVCTDVVSERKAIYHGIGVFYLDKTHSNKFILCFSKNITAMQIWKWTNLEQGKCKSMLEELLFVIHDAINKCETRRVSYTVKTKCADGDIHITAGQKSHTELTDLGGKKYWCEEHQQMHDASDSFQTWFENYSEGKDMKEKIKVYCRVRPISYSEEARGCKSVWKSRDAYSLRVETKRGIHDYKFDQVFMEGSTQEEIFKDTKNLIRSAVDGYNVCIFAYGQTGSGKTYTIIGDKDFPGIAPRAFERIFQLKRELGSAYDIKVFAYMLELYNDRLIDLLAVPRMSNDGKMRIRLDRGFVTVEGAVLKQAHNSNELFDLLKIGCQNRQTASTNMNVDSSRSHLIISIVMESKNKITGKTRKGKLSLIDLAGSERVLKIGGTPEEYEEAMFINTSLHDLGCVISACQANKVHIPYKNNKLTELMKDSIGGNAKTLMFVNISPADCNQAESDASLKFASKLIRITKKASQNSEYI